MPKPTAIVYIDGLNLHRRLIERMNTSGWVDYWRLVELILKNFEIVAVRVFTALYSTDDAVVAKDNWNKQTLAHPKLSIHLGRVKKTTRMYPTTKSSNSILSDGVAKVIKFEEKGSDVALATHMVLDASQNMANIYFVMSSDTDFEPALRVLKEQLGVQIGVISTTENVPKLFAQLSPNVIRHVKVRHVAESRLT
jgi:uncharacterized LabA/DUF88 family protein